MWMESEGRSPQVRCTCVPGTGQDVVFSHVTPIIHGHNVRGEGGIRGGSYLVLPTHGEGCWRSCDTPWATICYYQQILKSPGFMEFPGHPVVKTLSFHCWKGGGVSIPGQGTKIPHAMWHNQKKKKPHGFRSKASHPWHCSVDTLTSMDQVQLLAVLASCHPFYHSFCHRAHRESEMCADHSSYILRGESELSQDACYRFYHLVHHNSEHSICSIYYDDSFLFPRTRVRVDTTFIRASIGPPCEWRWKWQHLKPGLSSSPGALSPSIRPQAQPRPSQPSRTGLWGLWWALPCVWGVTLTVNAFVLEQGLHCVSLGENKNPWDTELTSRKGSRAKSANRLQS